MLDIGDRIRTTRKAAGLSQEDLARRAGMSLKGMGDIERGDIADPHYTSLKKIADGLGMSVGELLGEPVPLDKPAGREARLAPRIERLEGLELTELRDHEREVKEQLSELKRMVPFGSGVKEEITDDTEYSDLMDEYFAIQTLLQWTTAKQSSSSSLLE